MPRDSARFYRGAGRAWDGEGGGQRGVAIHCGFGRASGLSTSRALCVEGDQSLEDLLVVHVVRPAVGVEDGRVERVVDVCEGRADSRWEKQAGARRRLRQRRREMSGSSDDAQSDKNPRGIGSFSIDDLLASLQRSTS